jgi:lipopolysaccharide transport system permease protein
MAGFEFGVRLPLIVALFLYYQIPVDVVGILLGLAALLPLYILTLACGLALSVVAVVFRDLAHAMPIMLNVLLFISPIMYPISSDSLLGRANVFNPINHFITTVRNCFLGEYSFPAAYWISSLVVAVLLIFAWRLFSVAQKRIVERI